MDNIWTRLQKELTPERFKAEYLGEWPKGLREIEDVNENISPEKLWQLFSKICFEIGQPCARSKESAKPGDWYLGGTWVHRKIKHWTIFIMNDDGTTYPAFRLPDLHPEALYDCLMYTDAILFQYNANRTGEDKQ